MKAISTHRALHFALALFALAAAAPAAGAKKQAPKRPPLTEAERMQHIPPLPPADAPLVGAEVLFQEVDGTVVIEAEHFHAQTRPMIRRWYLNSPQHTPTAKPDNDAKDLTGVGGAAYVEALPGTALEAALTALRASSGETGATP